MNEVRLKKQEEEAKALIYAVLREIIKEPKHNVYQIILTYKLQNIYSWTQGGTTKVNTILVLPNS